MEMFKAKTWTVCVKQTKPNHSIRVSLIDVIVTDLFYLHVSLSEYSVAKLIFWGRILKLANQVEDTCLILKNNTSTYYLPFSYILANIYIENIKSLKFRHFKENVTFSMYQIKITRLKYCNVVLYSIVTLFY